MDALLEKRETENGDRKSFGIEVRNLRKVFGNRCGRDATRYKVAVRGISMEMAENEIFVLLGHNGAGKSTTISMLTGMPGCRIVSTRVSSCLLFPFRDMVRVKWCTEFC